MKSGSYAKPRVGHTVIVMDQKTSVPERVYALPGNFSSQHGDILVCIIREKTRVSIFYFVVHFVVRLELVYLNCLLELVH